MSKHLPRIGEEKCAFESCEYARRDGCMCCDEKHEKLVEKQIGSPAKIRAKTPPRVLPPINTTSTKKDVEVPKDLAQLGFTTDMLNKGRIVGVPEILRELGFTPTMFQKKRHEPVPENAKKFIDLF